MPEILFNGFNPSSYPILDYVTLRSYVSSPVDFTGWWLKVENQSGRFSFPPGFTLGPGQSVNIHSGVGTNNPGDLYMGLPSSLWFVSNNCAYLRCSSGELVDHHCVE
jgi:competence protein ComEC